MADERIVLTLEADDNASQKIDNVTKSLRNMKKTSSGMGSGVANGISDTVSKLEGGISKINNVTRHYNVAMSGFNNTVKRSVKEMGSAVYDFTTESINNFTQFSEQHTKVLGAMAADYDNTAQSQAKFFQDAQKLKEQAMQLGTYGTTGKGALLDIPSVSQAQESLIKAGVPASEIVSGTVLQDILTFAQANGLNTDTAVDTAVTLGNQFNIPMSDWGEMLDKISHTADMSVVEVSDITTSLKWASGISAGLNRDFEEVLAMLTVLGDFGLKGSQSGTGVQALLTRLLTGDTTVITQAQAEAAPGNALEKFYEFEKKAKPDGNLLPMADVIDELNATMEDMTDEEQAWFGKKLFGLYQMKSAYALINGDDVDLDDVIKEIKTMSSGTNENKLKQLLDSQYGQLESLNNLWEGIKTDVGDRLSPFVDAVRDELFTFLSNNGNYEINFDNLRTALDEACDLIEERYGSAIANAVRGIGDLTIDLAQVAEQLAPELGSGLLEMLGSLFDGDLFGKGGVFDDWNTMIDNMHTSADGLPEDLRDLGNAVVSTIDWFGNLVALNVASEIAELISSVLQILTIAGGAVINVAGAVVVNGTSVGGGAGKGAGAGAGAGTAGAGAAGASSVLKGSSTIGSADDVAKALGTTTDDVVSSIGQKASYTVDDVARGLGSSVDDVIKTYGQSIDDVIQSGSGAIDDVARGGSKLFGSLSKTGKALGIFGTMWQIGASGYEAYGDFSSGDTKGGVEAIGGGAGSLAGAYGGATLGTYISPGIGTVIGAIIGGLGGDKLARDLTNDVYDNFSNADTNYGTWAAGLPIIGGLWQKDGTSSQQTINAANESRRNSQEKMYNIKPSDFGLPNVFDNYYDGKTGEIPWTTIISELQLARDYPLTWGRKESEYGMNVDEAKSWQDSKAYQEYMQALNGAKEELISTQEELEKSRMVRIKKGDANYDPNLDVENRGQYNVWTGNRAELSKYLEGKTFIGASGESSKGTVSDPYMLGDLSEEIKNGIISGLAASKNETNDDVTSNGSANMTVENATLNVGTTNLTGSVTIPNIDSLVKQFMPNGYAALSNEGKQNLINQIDNQIHIDDSITMQPRFNVSAPNVNVNVRVDKNNKVTSNSSILNPGQGTLLDNWYTKTSSQYGTSNK